MKSSLFVVVAFAVVAGCGHDGGAGKKEPENAGKVQTTGPTPGKAQTPTFMERRAAHQTKLVHRGPSPQPFDSEDVPAGAQRVTYTSGALSLHGWFARPAGTARVPAVIYFHGGWAFGASDFDDARAFLDAGFALFAPTLRAENGNPGDFELFYGEVDDARAAIAWLRARPDIDPDRVYVFGHSAGGMISALVSLYPDTGLRMSGSAGGLYEPDIIEQMGAPYDPASRIEGELRSPVVFADQFRVSHIGYVGDDDALAAQGADRAAIGASAAGAPLRIERVPGDHHSSLAPAIGRFVRKVQEDAKR